MTYLIANGTALVLKDEMAKIFLAITRILLLAIFSLTSLFSFNVTSANFIPVTPGSKNIQSITTNTTQIAALHEFVDAVKDGKDLIRGVYVENIMALRVMQQPSGNNGFVSSVAGVATQFQMADTYGTTGLLAHNFAAGSNFSKLNEKDIITIVYGDGSLKKYIITSVVKYQALSPNSPTSTFVDLTTKDTLTATKLFEKIYKGDPHLVLQTCIAAEDELSWGRLFIVAEPLEA